MFQKLLLSLVLSLTFSCAQADICSDVRGAKIIAQDDAHTYLGKIANAYEADSIFNTYGSYGSSYSDKSIWNTYGQFGSEYSNYSPLNKYTDKPPMLIKNGNVIGYLTANNYVKPGISPNKLKALCEDVL